MFSKLSLVAAFGLLASVCSAASNSTDPLKPIKLVSPDGSVEATFIALGATATSLWVKDKKGVKRDILLGYDNLTNYQSLADGHPYFGPVVGRYANRIRNGTFTIPVTKNASGPNKIKVVANENGGKDTLHGGDIGYDQRVWNVVDQTQHSVTFSLLDPDGFQGFPGNVIATVVYSLGKGVWNIRMTAVADQKTPIMLSGHHYWNLEAYKESQDINGHIAQFSASRVIATDGILIPNGKFINVGGTPLDFRKAKSIGRSINATASAQYCGTGCVGFDNAWVYDHNTGKTPVFSLWSANSGIRMDVTTNQPALQIYSCNGINNPALPIPRKKSQGGPDQVYENHSCVVVEQESYIDGINNPEWGVDQIYGGGREYEWDASYKFSVVH